MADSDRIRKERQRRHARGDHELCKAGWCDMAPGVEEELGAVETAVRDFVGRLEFGEADARRVTAAVAVRLAEAVDRRGSAAAAAQLRVAVSHLIERPADEPGDALDDLRARHHARRLEAIIAHVSRLGNGAAE